MTEHETGDGLPTVLEQLQAMDETGDGLSLWPAEVRELHRILETAQRAHDAMDELNARLGSQWELCRFCNAHEYDGEHGILHYNDCPLLVLRLALAHEDVRAER